MTYTIRPDASPPILIQRNVTVSGHRTSVRLEPQVWEALREICERENLTIHQLATMVGNRKPMDMTLTGALRLAALEYFRAASTESGHQRAGHGRGAPILF